MSLVGWSILSQGLGPGVAWWKCQPHREVSGSLSPPQTPKGGIPLVSLSDGRSFPEPPSASRWGVWVAGITEQYFPGLISSYTPPMAFPPEKGFAYLGHLEDSGEAWPACTQSWRQGCSPLQGLQLGRPCRLSGPCRSWLGHGDGLPSPVFPGFPVASGTILTCNHLVRDGMLMYFFLLFLFCLVVLYFLWASLMSSSKFPIGFWKFYYSIYLLI